MIKGRVFTDTWGTRKTVGNLIQSPVDQMEYILRAQNWSENSNTPLINTSTFDSSNLTTIKNAISNRQISDYNDMYTDELVKSLCNEFDLVNYQDNDGNECVDTLNRTETPATVFTYTDCIKKSNVRNPEPQEVFVEPVLNYAYDHATGAYLKTLRVLYIADQSVWSADCTPGYNNTDGETVWNTCKALYNKYKRIEQTPSMVSDAKWITEYADAVNRVKRIMAWIDKQRIDISVKYTAGRKLRIGQHIGLNLPVETGGVQKECVIEEIGKDKNSAIVDLGLIIL